jgi:hypothetical protein
MEEPYDTDQDDAYCAMTPGIIAESHPRTRRGTTYPLYITESAPFLCFSQSAAPWYAPDLRLSIAVH